MTLSASGLCGRSGKAESVRQKDEFRVLLFVMVKEVDDVICLLID